MYRFFFILVLITSFDLCWGQKKEAFLSDDVKTYPIDERKVHAQFLKVAIGTEDIESSVKAYLEEHIKNLHNEKVTIQLSQIKRSPAGVHLTFNQYYNGVIVYRSPIKVNLDTKGNILSIFDNSYPIDNRSLSKDNVFPNEQSVMRYYQDRHIIAKSLPTFNRTYFLTNNELVPSVVIYVEDATNTLEVILDNEGKPLYERDMLVYAAPKDTTVKAMVFLPDPLTTAKVTYGAPYVDSNDSDIAALNAQRVIVDMVVEWDSNGFYLRNPYVEIREFSLPDVPPVINQTNEFYFTRDEEAFEDVNVYYHINAFRNYIVSLGMDKAVDFLIHIDTHGHNGAEQSSFNPIKNPTEISYGEGGVDDAEDADVIIHEYGHAIVENTAPNTNYGTERQTIDEANGDYFAVSYSRSIQEYNWENVFSWDGHNEFWAGRTAVSTKHYPQDIIKNKYKDTDIWSATLMEIWEDIGREETDRILLQSTYSYAGGLTMPEAAMLFVQADSLLNNGKYHTAICARFNNRGILDNCKIGDYCTPIASFNMNTNENLWAKFTNTSYNANYFKWYFGDGNQSREENPSHLYAAIDNYIVTLAVSSSCGSDTLVDTLSIEDFIGISLKNSFSFAFNEEDAVVAFQSNTDAVVSIYDIMGKLVYRENYLNIKTFGLSEYALSNGVYIMRIVTPKNRYHFKLVKN